MIDRKAAITSLDYSFEDFLNSIKVTDLTDANLEAKAKIFVEQMKVDHDMAIEWRWSPLGGVEFF